MLWSESSIVGKTSLSTITWSMRHCSLQTAFAIIAKFIPSSECRWTRISSLIPCCRGGRYGWSLLAVLATFEYGNPKGPSHGSEGQWMYLRGLATDIDLKFTNVDIVRTLLLVCVDWPPEPDGSWYCLTQIHLTHIKNTYNSRSREDGNQTKRKEKQ